MSVPQELITNISNSNKYLLQLFPVKTDWVSWLWQLQSKPFAHHTQTLDSTMKLWWPTAIQCSFGLLGGSRTFFAVASWCLQIHFPHYRDLICCKISFELLLVLPWSHIFPTSSSAIKVDDVFNATRWGQRQKRGRGMNGDAFFSSYYFSDCSSSDSGSSSDMAVLSSARIGAVEKWKRTTKCPICVLLSLSLTFIYFHSAVAKPLFGSNRHRRRVHCKMVWAGQCCRIIAS